ncbi:SDR family oxidoreductase [Rhodococcus opacus]|uniref:SDR family oxidoreductase n=1 Tax=Rhodococcus opacus TaxID=37919 RepID=UPI0024124ABE|nr:SDR family oxidoreductase [Rhodococcus opacus]
MTDENITRPVTTNVTGRVAVVTGAASGIGAAIAHALSERGASIVILVDRDGARAERVAAELPGAAQAIAIDATDSETVREAIGTITTAHGPIGLWCGNAGVVAGNGLGDDSDWHLSWKLHVESHLTAIRELVPAMSASGGGTFVFTASAAGLLTSLESAPYAVSKHGTVALAEWCSIAYADQGIRVHCLCPQAVRTPMTDGDNRTLAVAGALLEPAAVADCLLDAIDEGRFLVLPHPEVAEYEQRRTRDRDRWLSGMAHLRRKLNAGGHSHPAPLNSAVAGERET